MGLWNFRVVLFALQKEITARCCVCEFLRVNIGMLWGIGPGIYASWLIVMGRDLRRRQIQDYMASSTATEWHCDPLMTTLKWSRKIERPQDTGVFDISLLCGLVELEDLTFFDLDVTSRPPQISIHFGLTYAPKFRNSLITTFFSPFVSELKWLCTTYVRCTS